MLAVLAMSMSEASIPLALFSVLQVYSGAHGRTMVFTSTKQEANELALSSGLKQECQVLHGDIPQRQREITLKVCGMRVFGEGGGMGPPA